MRRPAISRFGGLACAAALLGCLGGKAEPVARPALEPSARDISGPYWCAIDDAGYEYPRYPCVIKHVEGRLMLAKLAGSQRMRGQIRLDERDGFTFVGELYCPGGACTEAVRGRFRPMGKGGFRGVLNGSLDPDAPDALDTPEASRIVTMFPAPANAFGGSSYGGDGYGDPFGMVGGGEADSTIDKP